MTAFRLTANMAPDEHRRLMAREGEAGFFYSRDDDAGGGGGRFRFRCGPAGGGGGEERGAAAVRRGCPEGVGSGILG